MIAEQFGGLDEGLVSRDRRAISEKIEGGRAPAGLSSRSTFFSTNIAKASRRFLTVQTIEDDERALFYRP